MFYRLIAKGRPGPGAHRDLRRAAVRAALCGALLLGETVTLAMAGYGLVILLGVALSTEAINQGAGSGADRVLDAF